MGVSNKDIYAKLTDSIIAQMKKGTVPWVRPWKVTAGAFGAMPLNAATRRPYSGLNVILLWITISEEKYTSSGFCTFNQARKAGAMVRKGEKATPVLFMKKLRVADEDNPGKKKDVLLARTFSVFNLDQLDDQRDRKGAVDLLRKRAGDSTAPVGPEGPSSWSRLKRAEAMVKSTGAVIKHGGNRAYYDPRRDVIGMPPVKAFDERSRYYGVLFHEMAHWTGHDSRLDRHKLTWMQTEQYAMEELVAELAAAFTCARFGMAVVSQHAAYLRNWLEALQNDASLIVKAASAATKAVQLITGEAPEDFAEEPTEGVAKIAERKRKPRATRRTTRRSK